MRSDPSATTSAQPVVARAPLDKAVRQPKNGQTTTSIESAFTEPLGLDVGVPVLWLDGVAASGPVLAAIPRGQKALDVLDAVHTMTRLPAFVRLERATPARLVKA